MCYSAMVWAEYKRYMREFGAHISLRDYHDLFWRRRGEATKVKVPKAMEAEFAHPTNDEERAIKALIDEYTKGQETSLQQELFKQRKRMADAERSLQTKTTKKAVEDVRIATSKIDWAKGKLADLQRQQPEERDSRIFPLYYAPVMVMQHGQRVVRPMRYQCRPAGKPEWYDTKFPGTYNARRDNLDGFWKALFGTSHGVIVASAFFENVNRHRVEGRELRPDEAVENVVLEFRPRPTQDMLLACLWSEWAAPDGERLLSFALITDDPPPEVAAAGHDRCVIPIKPENLDAWLSPDPKDLKRQYAILEDRAKPYFLHQMAA